MSENGKMSLPAPPQDPDRKLIKISKLPGGKWSFEFKGPIRQLDINHISRFLRVEYNRGKRKKRLEARKLETQRRIQESSNNQAPSGGSSQTKEIKQ